MKGSERAELRAQAHHLTATVHVGQHGITPALVSSLDDALRTQELVKVKLGRNADIKARDAAARLSADTASAVIQVIGHTATFYRKNPDIQPKKKKEE